MPIPQPPKPTTTQPAVPYRQRKKQRRTISVHEDKIDMYSWDVNPKRIYADLTGKQTYG